MINLEVGCMVSDTIAAISTALSSSGIGIVRISGDNAFDVINRIFVTSDNKVITKADSHTIHYGHIADGDGTDVSGRYGNRI